MAFFNGEMARGDWQGRARAEVANMAFDLGISWPIDRTASGDAAMALDALDCVTTAMQPNSTSEAAFFAGASVARIRARWEQVITSIGNGDTNRFYKLADDQVARGKKPDAVYREVTRWIKKNRPGAQIPTKGAWKQHRARDRAKTR
jgi:hypothetical protein